MARAINNNNMINTTVSSVYDSFMYGGLVLLMSYGKCGFERNKREGKKKKEATARASVRNTTARPLTVLSASFAVRFTVTHTLNIREQG